jgi:hypothetical protein
VFVLSSLLSAFSIRIPYSLIKYSKAIGRVNWLKLPTFQG